MGYELIKSQIETNFNGNDISNNDCSTYKLYNQMNCNASYQEIDKFEEEESEYFNIKVRNKKYPSCYRYNILIMLAKRLIKEEEKKEKEERINACGKRNSLYKKLVFRIIDD